MSSALPAQPIDSADNRDRIFRLIPDTDNDDPVRILRLGVYVRRDGSVDTVCCASANFYFFPGAYASIARRALQLKFSPAIFQNERLGVYVVVTIIATQAADGYDTVLLVNSGQKIEKYGVDYSGPQRVWSRHFPKHNLGKDNNPPGQLLVNVDRFGNPSEIRVEPKNAGSAGLRRRYIDYVASSCFVPAIVQGESRDMLYKETLPFLYRTFE